MVALGLGCFARASSLYGEPGSSLMCGPLMVAASLWWAERLQQLRLVGSGVVALIDFCFPARGIFPDQGLNLRLLDWQAGSLPLCHQRSPTHFIYF